MSDSVIEQNVSYGVIIENDSNRDSVVRNRIEDNKSDGMGQ